MKKAESLSINTVVIALLALIVLVVLIAIVGNTVRNWLYASGSCKARQGTCSSKCDMLTQIEVTNVTDCPGKVCCVPLLPTEKTSVKSPDGRSGSG